MSSSTKVALALGYVLTAVLGFIAGRESLKAEIRSTFKDALEPLSELAGALDSGMSAIREPATPAVRGDPSWRVSESRSSMDDSPVVTISIDATEPIRAWPSESHYPTLMIRCKERQTDLFIHNGTSANVEYGLSDGATVRLRLDSAKAFRQEWSSSTSGDALFAPSPISLARRLNAAKVLTYEFTPFNSSPQQTTFQLKGLDQHLPKVAAACGWKP